MMTLYRCYITLSIAMICLLQLATKCQQIIHKSHAPYYTPLQWGNYTNIACSITPLPP